METSSFEDPMFSEFSPELNPMGPKAIQHHHYLTTPSHHHHHHQPIMIGNGDINHQHTRLPGISEIQQVLPGNSPKLDGGHYKTLEYSHVKLESPSYSPNGNLNGNTTTKLETYSVTGSNGGQKLEYTSNGQYSPNAKIIEYSTSTVPGQQHIEQHIQLYHQPQSLDGNQQTALINGNDGNFKRKSDENLNNLSGSPTPTTIINSSISPSDANSTTNALNKKPSVDKKKNDPNGVKKKKTR